MKRTLIALTSALALLTGIAITAAPAFARQRGPQIDPETRNEIEGTVIELQAARGTGMPALVLDPEEGNPMTVRLGPSWYIDQSGFQAAPGDRVRLVTYECPSCDADAVAASVENLTNGKTLTLRDDQGRPEWMGSGRGQRHARQKGMMGRGHGMMGQGQGRGPGDGTGPSCPRAGAAR